MKIAITQPCFIPWPGYFWLINYVDELVFLDDVQFDHRSWQHRNFIDLNKEKILITIPVHQRNRSKENINQKKIFHDGDNLKKILKKIYYAYEKAPFFSKYFKYIEKIFNEKDDYLIRLNLKLIFFILEELNIKTKMSYSSELKIKEKKSDLIYEICKKKNCEKYISTIGAKGYIQKEKFYDIEVNFYSHIEKNSLNKDGSENFFSILHYLFHYGPETSDRLKNSFKILN